MNCKLHLILLRCDRSVGCVGSFLGHTTLSSTKVQAAFRLTDIAGCLVGPFDFSTARHMSLAYVHVLVIADCSVY